LPEQYLRVPGFISEVMDHCLETAPYPNPVMAFCGALALQAFLAGRKVRDDGDNRTNLYLLGLAHSAAGKDWPRKINTAVAHQVGVLDCLGDRFASGEGIQDALFLRPAMLFQTDEIDGMLQSINKARDARHESIMGTLLTLYSASSNIFPMRRRANDATTGSIDQPCLVLFGTAIPNHYYEALSERMLTNGFFARMIILESGRRTKGQEPVIRPLPERVVETAKWWANFNPAVGNLTGVHPTPATVEYSEEARKVIVAIREEAEAEYESAEYRNDPVGTTVWGRVSEHARKLSLISAISRNHVQPYIEKPDAEWATRFVLHMTRRMLFMAQAHVADNQFEAHCLKVLQKLRAARGNRLSHSDLLRRMRLDAKTFGEVVTTLIQRNDIDQIVIPRAGSSQKNYRLHRCES